MSRFDSGGDSYSNYCFLWESRVLRVIEGKRGQRVMREFAEALLALPQRRLIAGNISTPQGEVCAIGAYAKAKGVNLNRESASLDDETLVGWEGSESETAELGESLGMTYTLAWEIGSKNDEEFAAHRYTPEKRWEAMYRWAVSQVDKWNLPAVIG